MSTKTSPAGTGLSLLVSLPIWYYLLYKILYRVDASELMWAAYVIYIPAGIISVTLHALAARERK